MELSSQIRVLDLWVMIADTVNEHMVDVINTSKEVNIFGASVFCYDFFVLFFAMKPFSKISKQSNDFRLLVLLGHKIRTLKRLLCKICLLFPGINVTLISVYPYEESFFLLQRCIEIELDNRENKKEAIYNMNRFLDFYAKTYGDKAQPNLQNLRVHLLNFCFEDLHFVSFIQDFLVQIFVVIVFKSIFREILLNATEHYGIFWKLIICLVGAFRSYPPLSIVLNCSLQTSF